MNVKKQIEDYLASQPEAKQGDMRALHGLILRLMPDCQLWFLDGKDETGKTVSNPNIGYGRQTQKLAGGKTREFYQVGMSANTAGISIYLMGIEDRAYLGKTYGKTIGKADVTGYCIKLRSLKNIDVDVLESAIRDCAGRQSA
ncbi:MAG: hypothetical protein U0359_22450 [Byssovorax sp.]